MAAYLGGSELGPGREAAGVDGIAPSGEGGREHGGMVICDAIGNGGRGGEEGVGRVRCACAGRSRCGSKHVGKVEAPQLGEGGASAGEDDGTVG